MDRTAQIETMRRYIQTREVELLSQIPQMSEAELRWTVRLLGDCMSDAARALALREYSEYLPVEWMRHHVAAFVEQYTKVALSDLEAKASITGAGLAPFTDEELQAMSCAEKWGLLAADEASLTPPQLRRELARLLLCPGYDLYHDPSLAQAAIEYPAYFELQEAMSHLPDGTLIAIRSRTLPALTVMTRAPRQDREGLLRDVRREIAEAVDFPQPLEALFEGRMDRIPRETAAVRPATPPLYMDDMSPEDLRTSLRILADLMSLEEARREFNPLHERYRAFAEVPPDELKETVRRLAFQLGDRSIGDAAGRYRWGRRICLPHVAPQVWMLLPQEEKVRLLLEDNNAMDVAQTSRHISRIFMSTRYEVLHDLQAQVAILKAPLYQRLTDRLVLHLAEPPNAERLRELNATITRMMVEVEEARPEARPARLLEVRKVIGDALGLPDAPVYAEETGETG